MRVSSFLIIGLTFVAAAGLSLAVANYSVTLVEDRSEIGVRTALDLRELTWAEVSADGLQVTLSGTAPTEALRFQAVSAAGTIVDAARVIDEMQVEAQAAIAPPRFSLEILRNDGGISASGLIPLSQDREELAELFSDLSGAERFTDLLESANYPMPRGWDDAVNFSVVALAKLPRAKISAEPGRVEVNAISDSAEEKRQLERDLQRAAPPGLTLVLNITAPRPVLTPFTLRFVHDGEGIRFDACSAEDETARDRIIQAAFAAGLTGQPACTIGMGVPSPRWAEAAELAISAVARLGGGTITFSDADISLLALEGTEQALFDQIVGELENTLPEVFALTARLPETVDPNEGPPEFTATLSPEGLVQLRGRLSDEASRGLATSYARSLFGSDSVYTAARIDEDLPAAWSLRVLTALEALGALSNGAVVMTPDTLSITGNTGDQQASSRVTQLLAEKLGEGQQFDIQITYQEKLDPVASLPTPEECEAEISAIAKANKIIFEPGSATIDAAALGTMDDIAEILKQCGDLKLEIQGHTDSQGRESMNLQLSQDRAQSVLDELRARRVLTAKYTAKGYGEAEPIADNKTEEGREANRRIEFKLIRPAASAPEQESTLDSLAQPGADLPAENESGTEPAPEAGTTTGDDQ